MSKSHQREETAMASTDPHLNRNRDNGEAAREREQRENAAWDELQHGCPPEQMSDERRERNI